MKKMINNISILVRCRCHPLFPAVIIFLLGCANYNEPHTSFNEPDGTLFLSANNLEVEQSSKNNYSSESTKNTNEIENSILIPKPHIDILGPERDFGTVKPNAVVSHECQIVNVGDSLLQIQDIRKGCGCTTTTLGKSKVEPGESVNLLIQWNVGSGSGNRKRIVSIYSNDPYKPVVKISLYAHIKNPAKSTDKSYYISTTSTNITADVSHSQDILKTKSNKTKIKRVPRHK